MIATRLYFAGLEQLFDLVVGVWCLLFACISEVWRNCLTLSVVWRLLFAVFCRSYLTLSVESGDSYSLVFCIVWSNCLTLSVDSGDCRYGAIIRPCQWSPVMVICFYFVDLKQLFDHVSGVRWLVLARICHVWRNDFSLSMESGHCLCSYVASLEQLLDLVIGVW